MFSERDFSLSRGLLLCVETDIHSIKDLEFPSIDPVVQYLGWRAQWDGERVDSKVQSRCCLGQLFSNTGSQTWSGSDEVFLSDVKQKK